MSDKIFNFYDKLGIKGSSLPKTWAKHSSSSAFYWHSKQISGPPLCPIF